LILKELKLSLSAGFRELVPVTACRPNSANAPKAMQLQGLSRLRKQYSARGEHVYYVPASPETPADASPTLKPEPQPSSKASSKLEPPAIEVLEEVRKSVSAPLSGFTRRHSWGGDVGELQEDADSHPAECIEHERRLAKLLLPGLKRELRNTPPGQRGQLLEEVAEAQRCLGGDGIPKPRVFAVSRKCDSEQGLEASLPGVMRSASW